MGLVHSYRRGPRRREWISRLALNEATLSLRELALRFTHAETYFPASPASATSLQLRPSLLREFHGLNQHENLGNEEREHHGGRHRRRRGQEFDVLALEAKCLVAAGTLPEDAAKDPKSCLISVTIELHGHPIAHAARVLWESGATPAQTKVGIQLALGKPKSVIADDLGIQLSSVIGYYEKAVSDSRSSQFRRARHENLARGEARQSLRRAG